MSTEPRTCDLCGAPVEVRPTEYRSQWILGTQPALACALCAATVKTEHFKRAGVEERDVMFHANFVGNTLLHILMKELRRG